MSRPRRELREALNAQKEIRDQERSDHAEEVGKALADIQSRASKRIAKQS
jgi:hypothetical protein